MDAAFPAVDPVAKCQQSLAVANRMSQSVTSELWSIFDARRVKAPEMRGLDATFNGITGWFKNRRPLLRSIKAQAARIEKLEPEIHALGATHFREAVAECRDAAKLGRLKGP